MSYSQSSDLPRRREVSFGVVSPSLRQNVRTIEVESVGTNSPEVSPSARGRPKQLRRDELTLMSPSSNFSGLGGELALVESDGSSDSPTDAPPPPPGCLRGFARRVVDSRASEVGITLLIVANCVTLALDEPHANRSGGSNALTRAEWKALDVLELVFNACFAAEMLLKMLGHGVCRYLASTWNRLDCIVITTNIAAMFATSANVSAFRLLRVLKALLMFERAPGLKRILHALAKSTISLAHLGLIFLFFLVIHSIWAVQLWSGSWRHRCVGALPELEPRREDLLCIPDVDADMPEPFSRLVSARPCRRPDLCVEAGNPDDGLSSFDSFPAALLVMFQCVTLNGWSTAMYRTTDAWGRLSLYFYMQLIGGATYIVLALAIIVIKDVYKTQRRELNPLGRMESHQRSRSYGNSPATSGLAESAAAPPSMLSFGSGRSPDSPSLGLSRKTGTPAGIAFAKLDEAQELFPVDYSTDLKETYKAQRDSEERGPVQRVLRFLYEKVVANKYFDRCTLVLIVLNIAVMTLEHHNQPQTLTVVAETTNIVIAAFFLGELLVKLMVQRRRYFRDPFNVVDFVAVLLAVFDLVFSVAAGFGSFTVFRALRLVRIVRVVRVSEDMKRQLEGVYGAMQRIGHLMFLIVVYVFTLSLMGMHLFGAKSVDTGGNDDVSGFVPDEDREAARSFSNFVLSVLTVLRILTGDQWTPVMRVCMRHYGSHAALYFAFGVLFGNILLVKLMLAIVMDHYEGIYKLSMPKKLVRTLDRGRALRQRREIQHTERRTLRKIQMLEKKGVARDAVMSKRMRAKTQMVQLQLPPEYRGDSELASTFLKGLRSVHPEQGGRRRSIFQSELKWAHGSDGAADPATFAKKTEAFQRGADVGRRMRSAGRSAVVMTPGVAHADGLLGGAACTAAEAACIPEEVQVNNDERALLLFGPHSCLRHWATAVMQNRCFETAVNLLIGVSCASLIAEPYFDSSILDVAITACFGVEALVKIVALGMVRGSGAYLRSGWNVLDLIILIVSVISYTPVDASEYSALKVFRALRALRPLRLLKRSRGVANVATALVRSVPGLVTVFAFVALVFVIFGVIGVQLFGGKLHHCSVPHLRTRSNCTGVHWVPGDLYRHTPVSLIVRLDSDVTATTTATAAATAATATRTAGGLPSMLVRAEWVNAVHNFDNIFYAVRTLMLVASLDRWQEMMAMGIAAVGVDSAPERDYAPHVAMFFLTFVAVVNFLLFSVFIAEVVMTYLTVRRELDMTSQYTRRELSYFYMMKLLLLMSPSYDMQPRKSRSALICHRVTSHKIFEHIIEVAIVLNIIVMTIQYHGMSDGLSKATNVCDYCFTFLFLVEALLKLWALGFAYFRDVWNRFDFFLVVSSLVEFLVTTLNKINFPFSPLIFRSLRAFLRTRKAQRILRLVRQTTGVKLLSETLLVSMGTLAANLLFFVVVWMMYAFLGSFLFGGVRRQWGLNDEANFEGLWPAMVTLLRVATGENWAVVFTACVAVPPWCGSADCGYPFLATVYFFSFRLLSYIVLVNLFVATVLENYTAMVALSGLREGRRELACFVQVWSNVFSNRKIIPTKQLPRLFSEVGRRSDIRALCAIPEHYQRRDIMLAMSKYRLLDHKGVVHFSEVLLEVAFHTVQGAGDSGEGISRVEWWSFESSWHQQVPKLSELPVTRYKGRRHTALEYFAVCFVQQWFRFLRRVVKLRRLLLIDVCSFRYLHDDRLGKSPQETRRARRGESFAFTRKVEGRARMRRLSDMERRLAEKVASLTGDSFPESLAFLFGWGAGGVRASPRASPRSSPRSPRRQSPAVAAPEYLISPLLVPKSLPGSSFPARPRRDTAPQEKAALSEVPDDAHSSYRPPEARSGSGSSLLEPTVRVERAMMPLRTPSAGLGALPGSRRAPNLLLSPQSAVSAPDGLSTPLLPPKDETAHDHDPGPPALIPRYSPPALPKVQKGVYAVPAAELGRRLDTIAASTLADSDSAGTRRSPARSPSQDAGRGQPQPPPLLARRSKIVSPLTPQLLTLAAERLHKECRSPPLL
eukprot:TRINITY_DN5396_c0_g1_i1.p1 TRINITY_DN5396_c0_g1~~TRINITY_DN5396_c0_g1_i1.p1  ORF type:complete len:2034 (+),score=947.39 TRINITY_DN5396_c0_g1_i1:82-6183(+)